MPTVPIAEIFSSVQGEGLYVGSRQIFVRFADCNLACSFCDESGKPAAQVSVSDLCARITTLDRSSGPHAAVSLTGGEPLLHTGAFEAVAGAVRPRMAVYLETNGTLPDALGRVLPWVDVIAMDIKLSGVTGERNRFDENRRFLRQSTGKRVFVKIVVSDAVRDDEFGEAVALIRSVSREIPLVLQPLTVAGAVVITPRMLALQQRALGTLADVRIIPQMHILTGVP